MYIIIEIQTYNDGQVGTLVDSFSDRNLAEQKYHLILSAAAVSSVPTHAAVMLMDDGYQIKKETYYHTPPAPEPVVEEPVEEPEETEEP
jgi:hypothetical protein